MRAGRLKTRKIKVRRRFFKLFVWLMVLGMIAYFVYTWYVDHGLNEYERHQRKQDIQSFFSLEKDKTSKETLYLQGACDYTLQAGAFSQVHEAKILAEQLKKRGAACYLLKEDGLYRLLLSSYKSRVSAQEMMGKLKEWHEVETVVHVVKREHVTLQLSGKSAQTSASKDLLNTLFLTPSLLFEQSFYLDKGEKQREQVQEVLVSHKKTLEALKAKFESAFVQMPSALLPVQNMCEQCIQNLDDALLEQSLSAFGGKIKYAQLYMVDALCAFVEALHF